MSKHHTLISRCLGIESLRIPLGIDLMLDALDDMHCIVGLVDDHLAEIALHELGV